MPDSSTTVRDLRRAWKPQKVRLQQIDNEHPTNVRFHRACSWLQRAEQASQEDLDLALLCQWVAFNALYGQWNQATREPLADCECWKHFLERMIDLDQASYIRRTLETHKPLVMSIFDDKFLSKFFWQDPNGQRANQARKSLYEARTWYLQGSWLLVLERLFDRVYFLRCQLVHGASTFNSELNRTAIRHCSLAMDHLLRAFLQVWIDFGADEDWGIMCYPPVRTLATGRNAVRRD